MLHRSTNKASHSRPCGKSQLSSWEGAGLGAWLSRRPRISLHLALALAQHNSLSLRFSCIVLVLVAGSGKRRCLLLDCMTHLGAMDGAEGHGIWRLLPLLLHGTTK